MWGCWIRPRIGQALFSTGTRPMSTWIGRQRPCSIRLSATTLWLTATSAWAGLPWSSSMASTTSTSMRLMTQRTNWSCPWREGSCRSTRLPQVLRAGIEQSDERTLCRHPIWARSGCRSARCLRQVRTFADTRAARGAGLHSGSASLLAAELVVAVAVVDGVDGDPGRDDLVDAVQDVGTQLDVGGWKECFELLHRSGPDDGRRDAGVVEDERDGHLDERQAGFLGQHGEVLDGVELALVCRHGHVEPAGRSCRRGRGCCGVLAPPAREPTPAERAVGQRPHAVTTHRGQDVLLDATHEQGVRRLLGDEPLQVPLTSNPLGLHDLRAGVGRGTDVADLALVNEV